MTLRELRRQTGLTQEQAAERTTLSQEGISAIERGRVTNPRLDTLEKIATAYGVTLDDVVAAVRETVAEAAA